MCWATREVKKRDTTLSVFFLFAVSSSSLRSSAKFHPAGTTPPPRTLAQIHDGVRARSLTVSLSDERRRGSINDLVLALVFVLAVALTIAAIYVAATS
jgi:hypothetical protein